MNRTVTTDHREKSKKTKREKSIRPCSRTKKAMEREGDGDTYYNWCAQNGPQRLRKRTGRVDNRRTNRDYPNYSITKNHQNTENSPGGFRRIAIIQTLVKDHQLTLM